MASRLRRAAPVRARTRLRPRPLPRLARASARRALARHPVVVRLRLRVRARAAQLGCRAATRVVVPTRSRRRAARPARRPSAEGRPLRRTQGGVLPPRLRARPVRSGRARRSIARASWPSSGRRRRSRSTTAAATSLFADVVERLAADPDVHAVVAPADGGPTGAALRAAGPAALLVPDRAVDALSLVALADLVVSAGGTMNREAVALGTPVYTTFSGRLGAVDERPRRRGSVATTGQRGAARPRAQGPARPRSTRPPEALLDRLLAARAG